MGVERKAERLGGRAVGSCVVCLVGWLVGCVGVCWYSFFVPSGSRGRLPGIAAWSRVVCHCGFPGGAV